MAYHWTLPNRLINITLHIHIRVNIWLAFSCIMACIMIVSHTNRPDHFSQSPCTGPSCRLVGWLVEFLPPSWRHAHAHFGFAHRQQPLRWLKPFLKHWYVKLYELIAPHTPKWINSVIKLGHSVWNIIYCLSRIKFKDRWVVFFIYDSFCWTKSPTAAGLGSRNDAM